MSIFWTVIGLICGLSILLPTLRLNTRCITLQTGLIINCVAALFGMTGMIWVAVTLLLIGSVLTAYALMTCASLFSSEVRK